MKIIKVESLPSTITESLKAYTDDVIEVQKKVVDEVTDEAYAILKQNAPVRKVGKKRGEYKRKLKKGTQFESLTEKRNALYADKPKYRLSHLLERAHATKKGGQTKAMPHFGPAEEHVQNNLSKRLEKGIGNIK